MMWVSLGSPHSLIILFFLVKAMRVKISTVSALLSPFRNSCSGLFHENDYKRNLAIYRIKYISVDNLSKLLDQLIDESLQTRKQDILNLAREISRHYNDAEYGFIKLAENSVPFVMLVTGSANDRTVSIKLVMCNDNVNDNESNDYIQYRLGLNQLLCI